MKVCSRTWPVILTLLTLLPLYSWLIGRWGSPGNETLSGILFAAVVLAYFLVITIHEHHRSISTGWLAGAGVWLLLFALTYQHIPMLISVSFAASALTFAMISTLDPGHRMHYLALWPLMLTALPVLPSATFYAAYPLRLITSKIAAFILGPGVRAAGASLTNGDISVFVDAPCAGIKMLLISLISASIIALICRLKPLNTCKVLAVALGLVILGNALRASTLCFFEIQFGDYNREFEQIIGLCIFIPSILIVMSYASNLSRDQSSGQSRKQVACDTLVEKSAAEVRLSVRHRYWINLFRYLFLAVCILAVFNPLYRKVNAGKSSGVVTPHIENLNWPTHWDGQKLNPGELRISSGQYMKGFPGEMQQFSVVDGSKTVLLRLSSRVSRQLHPSEDCYRGYGYKVTPMEARKDSKGRLWSRFEYEDLQGNTGTVTQCYVALSAIPSSSDLEKWIEGARSWPDASSWYWSASMPGSDVSYTLAITVAE